MKLIFRQYLASLKEREELDAILPDLLSELGYTVISRPMRGTRQYGVDVAATGEDKDGRQKLFLFSIKQGDLTRADWDGTPQALRSSINEIIDVYIPTRIPKVYSELDIVICLCFGGEIQEVVRDSVTLFTKGLTKDGVSFAEWNGDYMAGLLVNGILREQLIAKDRRNSFQKAVAMVDEPQVAFKHFHALLLDLCNSTSTTIKQRASILRQIYICLWVLFVWARDAKNVEGPYRASQLSILMAWNLIRSDVEKGTKATEEVSIVFAELFKLHFLIADELLERKILPFVHRSHALSVAVDSSSATDINLQLFKTLGRIAMRGLWLLWAVPGNDHLPISRTDWDCPEAHELADKIIQLISNNPILYSPVTDDQSIEIGLVFIFLAMLGDRDESIANYAASIIDRTIFSFRAHEQYPTMYTDYRTLIAHPRQKTEEYRKEQTKGSSLFPLLSLWASTFGESESAQYLATFAEKYLAHCNMQFWLAADDSEESIYTGAVKHGSSLGHIPITADGESGLKILEEECASNSFFEQLSAMKLGHWPILAMACQYHRLPLPPNLWLSLLKKRQDGDESRAPRCGVIESV